MPKIRGGQPRRWTIGTTPVRVLQVKDSRGSLTLIADASNTGTIYIGYDMPDVANSGDKQGIPLSARDQITEEPPNVFTGEVYAIASAAGQVLIVVETEVLEKEGA